MEKLNIISLFDGISCGQLALHRAYPKIKDVGYNYYASEIKKNGIRVTKHNFPNTIHIGDVTKIDYYNNFFLKTEKDYYECKNVFLLMGGSPCQDLSLLSYVNDKDKRGLEGNKSSLFYEYLRLLKIIKPKYFLLENVKMNKTEEEAISNHLGVQGIHINSKLVSFQNRPRIYWTNIPGIVLPEDKHISFQDHKETREEICSKYIVPKTPSRIKMWNNGNGKNGIYTSENVTYKDKINTVTRKQDRTPNSGLVEYKDWCRYLTRSELEQAQTLPVDYTKILTYNQMQDVVGDGWTVDVIAHILGFIPEFKA